MYFKDWILKKRKEQKLRRHFFVNRIMDSLGNKDVDIMESFRWEAGKLPNENMLPHIAKALKVPLEEIEQAWKITPEDEVSQEELQNRVRRLFLVDRWESEIETKSVVKRWPWPGHARPIEIRGSWEEGFLPDDVTPEQVYMAGNFDPEEPSLRAAFFEGVRENVPTFGSIMVAGKNLDGEWAIVVVGREDIRDK